VNRIPHFSPHAGIRIRAAWIVFAGCVFPILSCTTVREAVFPPTRTPTPTVTPTSTKAPPPTHTRIPIADRNLKDFAPKKSDLQESGFLGVDIPDAEEALENVDPAVTKALSRNLVAGFAGLFAKSNTGMHARMLPVNADPAAARITFGDYRDELTGGDVAEIPRIGEGSYAGARKTGTAVSDARAWTYREVAMEIDNAGEDDIGIDEMVRLARIVESRLEEAY
jgi:hypothetical protein